MEIALIIIVAAVVAIAAYSLGRSEGLLESRERIKEAKRADLLFYNLKINTYEGETLEKFAGMEDIMQQIGVNKRFRIADSASGEYVMWYRHNSNEVLEFLGTIRELIGPQWNYHDLQRITDQGGHFWYFQCTLIELMAHAKKYDIDANGLKVITFLANQKQRTGELFFPSTEAGSVRRLLSLQE